MATKKNKRTARQAGARKQQASAMSCSSCSSSCPPHPAALTVATFLFALFSLVHGYRFVTGFELIVDGFAVPVWFSGVVFLVMGAIAVWCYKSRCE